MSRINALTHLFNTGEVSRAGLNRIDKEALRLYAERQENILPYTIGKGLFRRIAAALSSIRQAYRRYGRAGALQSEAAGAGR
jgi:hypothetical protein